MTQPQVDARVHHPTPQPPTRQCRLHIARTVEVVAYPRGVEGPRIRNEIVAIAPLYANRLKRRLRREHAALHRNMTALVVWLFFFVCVAFVLCFVGVGFLWFGL